VRVCFGGSAGPWSAGSKTWSVTKNAPARHFSSANTASGRSGGRAQYVGFTNSWPPVAESDAFPYDCDRHASNTSILVSVLGDEGAGRRHRSHLLPATLPGERRALPAWITDTCPEVATHFTAFPYFPVFHRDLPVSTTPYAAAGVCTLKALTTVATAAGMRPPMLHAGSHLGALVHGGPIPWDDDIDVAMPWQDRERLLAACQAARHSLHPTVTLVCKLWANAIKVFVRPRGVNSSFVSRRKQHVNDTDPLAYVQPHQKGYWSPYIDLFLYKMDPGRGRVVEVEAGTGAPRMSFSIDHAFPLQSYYFAGLDVPGPSPALASARYDLRVCVSASFNHRLEQYAAPAVHALRLDCCALARAGFPFVWHHGSILIGGRRWGSRGGSTLMLRNKV